MSGNDLSFSFATGMQTRCAWTPSHSPRSQRRGRPKLCRARVTTRSCTPAVESPELLPELAPVSVKQQWPEPPCRCAASGALRDALFAIFRGEGEASPSLAKALSSSCSWSSALVDAKDRAGAAKVLKEFTGFVIDPVILFTDEQEEPGGQIRLNWLLSFTYPTPWRPQVTVSGQSLLALNAERDKITNIVDEWDASPWTIIEQARPRLSDILWLYPAPHAETDLGTRKLLASHKGYKLVRVAARPEMRIESQLLRENEVDMVTAFPAIPPYAFNGGLRRRENYSTVSPIAVRHLGGVEYEYAIPIPGTIYGSSRATPLPVHPSEKVRIVMTFPRCCAVIRYGGFASSKIFEEKLKTLLANLERDGYVPAGFVVDRARVWARQYDSKIGFNGKSEVAIGTSGGSAYGIPPRWNELLVELPEYERKQLK